MPRPSLPLGTFGLTPGAMPAFPWLPVQPPSKNKTDQGDQPPLAIPPTHPRRLNCASAATRYARPAGCRTFEMSASDISPSTRSTAWLMACHTGRNPQPDA